MSVLAVSLLIAEASTVARLGENRRGLLSPRAGCNFCDVVNNLLHFPIAHGWVDWERKASLELPFSNWKVTIPVSASSLVIRVEMQRNEVNTRANSTSFELLNESVPVDLQLFKSETQNIKMP